MHPLEIAYRIDAVDIPSLVSCARKCIFNRTPAISALGDLSVCFLNCCFFSRNFQAPNLLTDI